VAIVIFIITSAALVTLYGVYWRVLSKWRKLYAGNSYFCELVIDKNRAELEMNFLYREEKTRKGATSATYFRDSLTFYDRGRKKYFSIEDFKRNAKLFRKYKPPSSNRFFAENWNGRTIEAFVNRDDLSSEKFGAKENPVRIFKLKYGGEAYLYEKYWANLAAYKRSFIRDKFQTLEAVVEACQLVWIVALFAALNWILDYA
jgi:hypothetical protein